MEIVPPSDVAKIAAKALEMRQSMPPSRRGGTMVGVARARQLANRENLSPSTVKRMVSFFARHEVDKQAEGFNKGEEGYPSKGRIAWDLWGGDAGRAWAKKMLRQIEEQGVNEMIDVKVLAGAEIRRIDGKQGHIKQVSLPWVTVEWADGKQQAFLRSDEALFEDIQIKTLDKGWLELGRVVASKGAFEAHTDALSAAMEAVQALRSVIAESHPHLRRHLLSEAKKKKADKPEKLKIVDPNPHSPFHRWRTLGLQSPKGKVRKKKNIWKCSAGPAPEGKSGNYQVCVAQKDVKKQGIKKGSIKHVKVWTGAKAKAYLKDYEKGREDGTYKPGNSKVTRPIVYKHYRPAGLG